MQVSGTMPAEMVQRVAQTLNERLAGLSLQEIRNSAGRPTPERGPDRP